MKVSIDTGGTFTDFIWEEDGKIFTLKVPSTPENPSLAIKEGLARLGLKPQILIHGTTVATNAFLERKGADFLLFTTKGFEDVLPIGRQDRPKLYDFFVEKPPPFFKEENIIGVKERILANGKVWLPLEEREIKRVLCLLKKKENISSAAISFLHSYKNPWHEIKLGAALRKAGPYLVSLSSELVGEFREYERTSTTAINAYLSPILKNYLESLEKFFPHTKIYIQQANGGYMSLAMAKEKAVWTILSGPAGGAMAGLFLCKLFGLSGIITLDMGGTSTDVCLIKDRLPFRKIYDFDGFPVSLPLIDIHTVGAGGGSIAWIDGGGLLKVGPRSAGAKPGPACYGVGSEPTVTDANLLLGRLLPKFFGGGEIKLYPERSFLAIAELARKLGLTPLDCALGMVNIANSTMVKALRRVSSERGLDPSDFWLLAFGGASGLHACDLVEMLNLKGAILPKLASSFSALGLFFSVPMFDYTRTVLISLKEKNRLQKEIKKLKEGAKKELSTLGISTEEMVLELYFDLRYQGQGFDLSIPVAEELSEDLASLFHQIHQREFGFSFPHFPIEVVNLRLRFLGKGQDLHLRIGGKRLVFPPFKKSLYTEKGEVEALVVPWDGLKVGEKLFGPMIIVDAYTTFYLKEKFIAEVKEGLTLFAYPRDIKS